MPEAETEQEGLTDLPPSAKLVFKVLQYEGPLTQTEVAEASRLSTRTVRYAVNRLKDLDVVEEQVYMQDTRKSLYTINECAVQEATPGTDTCCAD